MQQQQIKPGWKAFAQGGGIGARFCGQVAHRQPRPAMRGNDAPERGDQGFVVGGFGHDRDMALNAYFARAGAGDADGSTCSRQA